MTTLIKIIFVIATMDAVLIFYFIKIQTKRHAKIDSRYATSIEEVDSLIDSVLNEPEETTKVYSHK